MVNQEFNTTIVTVPHDLEVAKRHDRVIEIVWKESGRMFFYVMIFSLAVGIALIAVGIYRRNKSIWYKISIIVGIALVLYAIYLGFPK